MADDALTLESLRNQIDTLDQQIHQLLNERAKCAQNVADVKLAEVAPEERASVKFYRPEREAQVLRKVKDRNQGPLSDDTVAHIFREVMSACLALEQPLNVAYLGPAGTFTHAAAIKHFGHAVVANSVDSIDQVFSEVESGEAIYGVVPVENSTEGMVNHTLDNFIKSTVSICGEVELAVKHMLLVNKSADTSKITRICAHQQALAQCRNYLDKHWPNVPRVAVSSNSRAAQLASDEVGTAAIAGDMAAEIYNVDVAVENIQDSAQNTTRFLIVGREQVEPSGEDKTSIIVSMRNEPGALFSLLESFQREEIMLTRIDTRPSPTEKWAYLFFIEFEGHQDEPAIQRIMEELSERSVYMKMLGSYPKAAL
ncbi:P-protein [BD1-7 clade bacterium]|uniref:Bifunctional chorismate mutase/prephenate dehydratase n=1 Tax=BD1-7 clade bacterium TaxID=2029982 RepID=A0A5S9PV95_9GAMM|nr:P-protein [BD1-7 clade bacterium]CAA0108278.1 P-protein [BD1-7 clade bacterium]CAA0108290.1 P-protein [BD1-7 clade bacterium]